MHAMWFHRCLVVLSLAAGVPGLGCSFDTGGVASDDAGNADAVVGVDGGDGEDATPADAGPAGTMVPGDVRLTYGPDGVFQLASFRFDATERQWEAGPEAMFETGTMRWTVNAAGRGPAPVELVATIGSVAASPDKLRMYRHQNDVWSVDWSLDVPASDKRGVDVAFEHGGDAMVVYADGTNTPKYRVRTGDVWGSEQVVPAPLAGGCPATPGCVVTWIELVDLPGTDRLALGFADTERNLTVILWNGQQWQTTSTTVLETNLKANRNTLEVHNRAFDLAFEQVSGNLMVLWGRNGSGMVWWSRYEDIGAIWSPVVGLDVIGGEAHFVDLETQPGENRIALGVFDLGDGTERLGAATWNGAVWVDAVELDSQTRNVNDGALSDWPGAVAWVGDSEQAVLVYSDNKQAELHWARWGDTRGWTLEAAVAIPGKKASESLHLVGTSAGSVVTAFTDDQGRLYGASYNGATWSVAKMGAPLSTGTASLTATPFSLAAIRP